MVKSVLLVDDDPMALLMTQEVIKNQGFSDHILIAMNGILALNEIESFTSEQKRRDDVPIPHVIFLDLQMPLMSGWDFLEYYSKVFAEKLPDTKIVILSSSITEHDYVKAQKFSSVTKILPKPLLNEKINYLKKNHHLQKYFA